MESHLQRFEVQSVLGGNDDLPVDDRPTVYSFGDRPQQFRKVSGQWLATPAGDLHVLATNCHDGTKAIPFRLVAPSLAAGDRERQLGKHGRRCSHTHDCRPMYGLCPSTRSASPKTTGLTSRLRTRPEALALI